MKKYLLFLSLALASFGPPAGAPVDKIGVKGPLHFHQTTFNLAWVSHPSPAYYIQEYLPAGETSAKFTQMLAVHVLAHDVPVKSAVQQKVQELDVRKKTDPTCNYQINESPDGTEYLVDCLLGESKPGQTDVAEFIIYRFRQVDLGGSRKGILMYSYSKRGYGDGLTAFYKALPAERGELLTAMITGAVPSVTLPAK
jgi:hypothetical protein